MHGPGEPYSTNAPLIHIGYHKTASTWLQRHLFRKHPAFAWLAFDKALYQTHPFQFDAEAMSRDYARRLEETPPDTVPVLSNERLSGHPHSGGHDSKEIADRLHAVFPDARILIVVREQKAAILSSYFQFIKKGGLCSLSRYIDPKRDGHVQLFDPDHFRYDGLIGYYIKHFGRDRVCVLPYEMLRDEPQRFIAELSAFSGTPAPQAPPIARKVNASAPPVTIWLKSCFNIFIRSDTVNGCAPFGSWLGAAILLPPITLAGRLSPGPLNALLRRRWQRNIDRRLDGYFDASNARTLALVGFDPAAHGRSIARTGDAIETEGELKPA
jgi:hypothetical protein